MRFVLQADPVSDKEKRAVRQFAMLSDHAQITSMPLHGIAGVDPAQCPVGTVEFVKQYAQSCGVTMPAFDSYPLCLRDGGFFKRKIRQGRFSDANDHEFVKPVNAVKLFTGDIKFRITDTVNDSIEVYISEPVNFVAEWRLYVINGCFCGAARYDDNDNDEDLGSSFSMAAINAMTASRFANFSLDIGKLANGEYCIVEANDGWALGYYRGDCTVSDYARLIWNRWKDIAYVS